MNKKTIAKLFVLGLGIFVMGGCSLNPVSGLPKVSPVGVQQEPVALPGATTSNAVCKVGEAGKTPSCVASSTKNQVATSTAQGSAGSKIDTSAWAVFSDPALNYTFKYPKDYFPAAGFPTVQVFDCNAAAFAQTCPQVPINGIADIQASIDNGMVKIGRQTINGQDFCTQTWTEGTAGSTFTTHIYTNVKNGKCSAMQMTFQFVDCDNFNPGAAQDQCLNRNNVVTPATLDAILASFNFNSSSPSGQVISQLQAGRDYQITAPDNYFTDGPKVFEVSCDIAKTCPCVNGVPGMAYDADQTKVPTFCQDVPPTRQGNYCVQQWSGAAAGTTYTTYFYTRAIPGSNGRCALIGFTKQFTSDCHVVEGNGAAHFTAVCEADKADAPGIIANVVNSFKLLQ